MIKLLIEQRDYRNMLKDLNIRQLYEELEKTSCYEWRRQYIRWELLDRKETEDEN